MGSPERAIFGSPIPLSDIEDVLEWVDTFKLSRPTKKINRDFADGVLLAEMLAVPYPKLVEMHNYPPRNSQAQKLNNWMTLNRKVLKKLKLNLCLKTMEQLSNSVPGVVERVLIMVRDKMKRDEEAKSEDRDDQELSSGGSYYEACSEEDNVLVVPVKQRNGGSLEMMQKKVVSHDVYVTVREQLKDAKDTNETLKKKIEHFESMMKVKEERIEELQRQLSRKASRRKENEDLKNSLSVTLLPELPSAKSDVDFIIAEKELEFMEGKDYERKDIVRDVKEIERKHGEKYVNEIERNQSEKDVQERKEMEKEMIEFERKLSEKDFSDSESKEGVKKFKDANDNVIEEKKITIERNESKLRENEPDITADTKFDQKSKIPVTKSFAKEAIDSMFLDVHRDQVQGKEADEITTFYE